MLFAPPLSLDQVLIDCDIFDCFEIVTSLYLSHTHTLSSQFFLTFILIHPNTSLSLSPSLPLSLSPSLPLSPPLSLSTGKFTSSLSGEIPEQAAARLGVSAPYLCDAKTKKVCVCVCM